MGDWDIVDVLNEAFSLPPLLRGPQLRGNAEKNGEGEGKEAMERCREKPFVREGDGRET